jgi:cytochrome P450
VTQTCPYRLPINQNEISAHDFESDFAQLRGDGALVRATFPFGGEGWVVTRYDEAKSVLADNRFSLQQATLGDYPRTRATEGRGPAAASFGFMDPPEHTRHRAVLTKHLTVKRVVALRPATEAIVDSCLDRFEQAGQGADLGEMVGQRVPVMVLCHMLGSDVSEAERFLTAAHQIGHGQVSDVERGKEMLTELQEYFTELVARRRNDPGDDLISTLLKDRDAGSVWSDAEFDGVGVILLLAGHDATATILNGALNWLVHDSETFQLLRNEPARIPQAIEEFLRFLPAGLAGPRTRIALERVEIGGIVVEKGDAIQVVPHSANLDERIFDDATSLDLSRNPNPHLAFGFGPHGCPGSQLARMEIDVAIRRVLSRYERLEPEVPTDSWKYAVPLRGATRINARWRRSSTQEI